MIEHLQADLPAAPDQLVRPALGRFIMAMISPGLCASLRPPAGAQRLSQDLVEYQRLTHLQKRNAGYCRN